jgi:hypothetical protein
MVFSIVVAALKLNSNYFFIKFQIPNLKFQINSKSQIPNTNPVLEILDPGAWSLEFFLTSV